MSSKAILITIIFTSSVINFSVWLSFNTHKILYNDSRFFLTGYKC